MSNVPSSTQAAALLESQLREQIMARQIAELQAQLAFSQAQSYEQARVNREAARVTMINAEAARATMVQREQMIAMAYQHHAAAEPRLDSGSTRGVKRLKTDSGSAPRPRPRGNAPFTALSARYKQRVILESSKAVTDRVGASADGRVAVAAQLVKSPTSFNLLLKLRRNQK